MFMTSCEVEKVGYRGSHEHDDCSYVWFLCRTTATQNNKACSTMMGLWRWFFVLRLPNCLQCCFIVCYLIFIGVLFLRCSICRLFHSVLFGFPVNSERGRWRYLHAWKSWKVVNLWRCISCIQFIAIAWKINVSIIPLYLALQLFPASLQKLRYYWRSICQHCHQ